MQSHASVCLEHGFLWLTMHDDRELGAAAEVPATGSSGDLDAQRLAALLNRINPQFKCEICLQDRFILQPIEEDGTAACLPFYSLKSPSRAISVRYFLEIMCTTCGNTKLLNWKTLEARLAHEG